MKFIEKNMKKLLMTAFISFAIASCSDKKDLKNSSEKSINVTIATPMSQQGASMFGASGQIEAEQFTNISSRTMGYVSRINVSVGDKIKKGQVLIQINNTDIKAKKAQADAGLSEAEAGFQIAEKDYHRFKKLHEQNSASQKEFDDISMHYEIAKAQVEAAKQVQNEINAILSYGNIKAPFSGVITSKSVNLGDMATPGMTLFQLETPGKFVATALIPETEIASIHKGQKVRVMIKASGKSIQGLVSEVSTSSQNTGGQYLVKISLSNDQNIKLYSGMYVSTNFPVDASDDNPVMVPESALVELGQLKGIYTVSKSNTAILRWIRTGKSMGDHVQVLSGLSKNEAYIVSAEGKLYNGVALNIK